MMDYLHHLLLMYVFKSHFPFFFFFLANLDIAKTDVKGLEFAFDLKTGQKFS